MRLPLMMLAICLGTVLSANAQVADPAQPPAQAVASDPLSEQLQPDPSLTPRQVVQIQLAALRNNDAKDAGIAVVFRFASPANRAQTGPVARFANMIKSGPYALMLDYESAVFDQTQIAGDKAEQRVVLISPQRKLGFSFVLSRQTDAPYKDCWMTELVGVVPIGGTMAMAPPNQALAQLR